MRGMYWKPEGASQVQRALVAALAVVGLVAVEVFPSEEQQPHYAEKMLAARKAQDALDVIRDASERRGLPLRPKTDPSASRMIGEVLSPITSGSGSLVSKQTSVNPNFAAVVVAMAQGPSNQERRCGGRRGFRFFPLHECRGLFGAS